MLCARLSLSQPDIFHAPAIKDAVDHNSHILHLGPPAGAAAEVVDHWTYRILGQFFVDIPRDLFALFLILLGRLLADKGIDLLTAIIHVRARPAGIVLGVVLIGVVHAVANLA